MHDLISPQIYEPAIRGCWFHQPAAEGREGSGYYIGGLGVGNFMDCDCLALGKCLPGEPPLPPMGEFVDDPKLNRGAREGWSVGQTEYPDLPKDHVYKPYDRIVRVGWEPSASGLTPDGYEGTNRIYEPKGPDAWDPLVPRRPVGYDSPDLIRVPPSEAPEVRAAPEPEKGEAKKHNVAGDGAVESTHQDIRYTRRHARDLKGVTQTPQRAEKAGESAHRALHRRKVDLLEEILSRHKGSQEKIIPAHVQWPEHNFDNQSRIAGSRFWVDREWRRSQLAKFEERQKKGKGGDLEKEMRAVSKMPQTMDHSTREESTGYKSRVRSRFDP